MAIKALSLAVVGAPYPNPDGSNRQFEIKLCSPGEPVELRREPKNRYDEHAVAVFTVRAVQIGYVSSERAALVSSWLRAGRDLRAIFQEEQPWGAVIRVGVDCDPELPPARQADQHETSDADDGFWPDFIPPDD